MTLGLKVPTTQVVLSFTGPCRDGQGRRESPLCA